MEIKNQVRVLNIIFMCDRKEHKKIEVVQKDIIKMLTFGKSQKIVEESNSYLNTVESWLEPFLSQSFNSST